VSQRASRNKTPYFVDTSLLKPYKIVRTVEGIFDVICDGVNPSSGMFNFSLNDLPNYTEFTTLFDLYKIEKVEVTFYPEYTVLSDSGLASNAVNVQFNTCIDPVGNTPSAYTDILQYSSCKSTGVTKQHSRVIYPMYLLDGIVPQSVYISTASPSTNHYGLGYGVPPTGVAMTFRSRALYYLSLKQAK